MNRTIAIKVKPSTVDILNRLYKASKTRLPFDKYFGSLLDEYSRLKLRETLNNNYEIVPITKSDSPNQILPIIYKSRD